MLGLFLQSYKIIISLTLPLPCHHPPPSFSLSLPLSYHILHNRKPISTAFECTDSITYFETGLGIFPATFLPAAVAAATAAVVVLALLDSLLLATETLEQMLEACECSEDTELLSDCGSTWWASSPSAALQPLDFSTSVRMPSEELACTAVSPTDIKKTEN